MNTYVKRFFSLLAVCVLLSAAPLFGLFSIELPAWSVTRLFSVFPRAATVVDSGTCGAEGGNLIWTLNSDGLLTISGTGEMEDYSYVGSYCTYTTAPWGGSENNANRVKSVTIGNGVTRIGSHAFDGCTGLTSVTIPDSVTTIGSYAFDGCTGLTKVNINDIAAWCSIIFDYFSNPLYYANHLYLNNREVTNVTIPNSVTIIRDSAFFYCTGLTSVTIPRSVTSIESYAFSGCSGLTSITIPDSVTSIGGCAFYNCTALASITIPDSVTSIGSSAFAETAWFDAQPEGLIYAGRVAYDYKGTLPGNTDIVLRSGTKGIAVFTFYDCPGLASITIPDSVTSIGVAAFAGCTGLTKVNISDLAAWCRIGFGSDLSNPLSYAHHLYLNNAEITDLTIPDEISKVGCFAFSGCAGLTSVTIPDSVTGIGESAFSGCTGLTSITVPDSVTSLGDSVFSGCTGLTSITIPDTVTNIGRYMFEDCTELTSIRIPDDVTSIGDSAFSGCTGLTSITIPKGVTSVGNYAFYDCTALTRVNISDMAAWCRISFDPSSPSNPLCYAHHLYLNNAEVTDLTIPDGITSIGGFAFYRCTGLTSVTIPDSVTKIGEYAFSGCTGLTSVTIPDSVTRIGRYAFSSCTGLTKVNISDIAAWNKISFDDGSNPLYYAHHLYLNNAEVTSLTIPDGETNIGNAAFSGCTGLTSVTIPDSVTGIGNFAFSGCTGLTSVTIPDSVTGIGNFAFSGCTRLTSITIPDSVTSIGNAAFMYCTELNSAAIGNGVTGIEEDTFSYCTGLTTVYLGTGLRTVMYNAFAAYNETCDDEGLIWIKEGENPISEICYAGSYSEWRAISSILFWADETDDIDAAFPANATLHCLGDVDVSLSETSFVYDGTEHRPTVTVTEQRTETGECFILEENTDYTVTYAQNSALPGICEVSISFGPWTVTKEYSISALSIETAEIALSGYHLTYNSTHQFPSVTVVSAAGETLTEDQDYTLFYSSDEDGDIITAGAYTVTVTGINGYTGSVTQTYWIDKQKLSADRVTLSWSSAAYNGAVQQPDVTVKSMRGGTLTKGTSYTLTYSADSKAPGTYTLTVKGRGNYTGTVTKSYTITKQPLAAARVTLSWSSKTYNGAVQKPTVTVKNAAGGTMTKGTSYTVSYSADSKVPGTYTVTVTGKGYYSGTATRNYTITKQALDASRVTLSATSFAYTGAARKPAVTVKNAAGYAMTEGSSYTLSWSGSSVAPGTYTVTATGKGYYTGTASKTYTVVPGQAKNLKVTIVTADKATLKWDAAPGAQKYMVYYSTTKDGTYTSYGSTANLTYTVSKAGAGSMYYKVRAFVTEDGTKLYGSSSAVARALPGQVKNLSAVAVSADKASLTWDTVPGAQKYMVYYSTTKDGTYTSYGSTANLTYTVSKAGAGSMYYKVRAFVTEDGTKLYGSSSAVARVLPAQVKNVKATKVSADKATLTWDVAPGAQKYMVYCSTTKDGTYTSYGSTANLTYTVSKSGAGTMYYKVRAFVTEDGAKLYGAYSAAAQAK